MIDPANARHNMTVPIPQQRYGCSKTAKAGFAIGLAHVF